MIDEAQVEEGARVAVEATNHPSAWNWDSFTAHWNPEFAAELARDWLRYREALEKIAERSYHSTLVASARVALANPAAEEGKND